VRKNGVPRFRPATSMTDYLADEATKAIAANRNRPFFLYFAPNAPHTPLQALREDYDALSHIPDHRLRVYAAMIRALDRAVGRILAALKTNGLDANTLVIFTSDNGGANYIALPDINRPYRGWKMTFFEGGIRSPFFMRWPGHLPNGTTFPAPTGHVDIFATAAAAAGAPLPQDRVIDGVNLLPFLRGEASGDPHQALFWRSGHYETVLSDGWKLQVSRRPPRNWLFHVAWIRPSAATSPRRIPTRCASCRRSSRHTTRRWSHPPGLADRRADRDRSPARSAVQAGRRIRLLGQLEFPHGATETRRRTDLLALSRALRVSASRCEIISKEESLMKVVNQMYPSYEQIAPLAQDGGGGPIAMVNLLKFRDRALYDDGRPDDISGREAYMRYATEMRKIVEGAGGSFAFSGDVHAVIIGEVEEAWDLVGIAVYPSRAEFHRLATSPEVQEIGVHRTAGLAGQLLILTTTPTDEAVLNAGSAGRSGPARG
jgi:uncharacterized protein (DUF1330 family)